MGARCQELGSAGLEPVFGLVCKGLADQRCSIEDVMSFEVSLRGDVVMMTEPVRIGPEKGICLGF